MIGGIRLKNVVEKADKGEKLSPSEEKLLDAAVTNMAVNAYYSSDLGRGYKAGQTTGASIPFMLEFAINPISAAGEGIAKSILKYGMKKFGASAMKKECQKWGHVLPETLWPQQEWKEQQDWRVSPQEHKTE